MSESFRLEKNKYRAQAGEIRASYAYVFRIVLDDELFLVGNEHYDNLRFQPVGGGYRFDDESLDDVKRYFGHKCAPGTVRSHQEEAVPEDNDFRLLLPAAGIESLCRFFNSTEDKVELTNLIQDPKEKQNLTKAYRATLEREEQELRANKLHACHEHKSTNRSQEHKITNDCQEGMIIRDDRPAIRYKIATSLSDSEVYAGMLEDTARMLLEQKGNGSLVCLIPDNHDDLIKAMLEAAKSCHGAQQALCHRETINDLRREFVEEMIESKIVPESMAWQFNELTYLYRGRHQEYFYDERFGTYSFFVCDILELIPNAQQLEVLRYLKAHEHDDNAKERYVFVKEDKIPEHLLLRSEAVTAVPFPPIADHSVKILSCNLNALTIPQSVASKTSDPQPIFSIKLS
ncbi:hypothetical protein [Anaerobiospirillum succiniciproducens]|uniref:SMODS-associated NUDIX domain-containing protein n=1 Tax=Anaerobiospirillum succiniciproducens TaxID=13335 RepID=UPI00042648B6|nr:hypothetical protein [Anaerobiospirillum succiniciproducens]